MTPIVVSDRAGWKNSYKIGIRGIDDEHFVLISLVSELHDAAMLGGDRTLLERILENLVSYVKMHFSREERLVQAHQYPEYPAHRSQHDEFARKVLEFQDDFRYRRVKISNEVLGYLKEWIATHIMGTDQKLGTFLKERGVR